MAATRARFALEVSEILEVFMVASQSDLFGLVPRSMIKFGQRRFGLRSLRAGPRNAPVPIKLVWLQRREADPAHAFLRKQIQLASSDVDSAASAFRPRSFWTRQSLNHLVRAQQQLVRYRDAQDFLAVFWLIGK